LEDPIKVLPLACLVATLLLPSTSHADCSDGDFVATFVVSNILGDGEPRSRGARGGLVMWFD
jgi:hypothetical protein